jgi:hypothetical protein
MSVKIYSDDNFDGYYGYFPSPAVANDLTRYSRGYFFGDWNDQVSSLKTTTPLRVYENIEYGSEYHDLQPGDFTLAELNDYNIANDSISKFFELA